MSHDILPPHLQVLVLEDDYYLADDARQILEAAGAKVIGPFSQAQEAIRAADARKPSCALVDINLGEGPSFAAAERLRSRGVPVIFVTGYDQASIPPGLMDAPRLEKPVEPRRIIEAVRSVCASPGG